MVILSETSVSASVNVWDDFTFTVMSVCIDDKKKIFLNRFIHFFLTVFNPYIFFSVSLLKLIHNPCTFIAGPALEKLCCLCQNFIY